MVLVKVDHDQRRPLIVVEVHPDGSVSGTIFCAPDDRTREVFRGWGGWETTDGARIIGQPAPLSPFAYGELLHAGHALGEWIPRPTHTPSGR